MLLYCGVGEDPWESLGLQWDQTSQSWRKSVLSIHRKDWCWSSNTLATWCEELTHWKRPWCWERWKAGSEGSNRGWDGWMASLTQWTGVWASSGSWVMDREAWCSWGHKELDTTEWLNQLMLILRKKEGKEKTFQGKFQGDDLLHKQQKQLLRIYVEGILMNKSVSMISRHVLAVFQIQGVGNL